MFFVLSKLLDVALEPLTHALLLSLGAGLMARRRPRVSVALAVSAVSLLVFFSCPAVAAVLARWAEEDVQSTQRPGVYDAVVFLGGAVDYGGLDDGELVPFGDNVERVHATLAVLRAGQARVAVLSGTGPKGKPSEAALVARQLETWGVSRERLLLDETSVNTKENAVNVAALARKHALSSLLLVTSAAHMARARECFWAAGLSPDLLPVDRRAAMEGPAAFWPRASALATTTRVLRELFGRRLYRWNGYGRAEPPSAPVAPSPLEGVSAPAPTTP